MKSLPDGWELDKAEYLLSQLPAGVHVGLATFADKLTPVIVPTVDHGAVRINLEKLRQRAAAHLLFGGKPELWEALRASPPLFETPQRGDDIFLFSISRGSLGAGDQNAAIYNLIAAGIRLHGLIYTIQPQGFADLFPTLIHQAVSTGGWIQEAPMETLPPGGASLGLSTNTLENYIRGLIQLSVRQVTNFYVIAIGLATPVQQPQSLEMNLIGIDKDTVSPLAIHYPRKLAPCIGTALAK